MCSIHFLLQDNSTFIYLLIEIEREGRIPKIHHRVCCQLAHIFFCNRFHYMNTIVQFFFVCLHFLRAKKPIVLIWKRMNFRNSSKKNWNIYWESHTSQIQWHSLLQWTSKWYHTHQYIIVLDAYYTQNAANQKKWPEKSVIHLDFLHANS